MRTRLTAAALMALSTAAMAGDNLMTNGSFETPGPGFILLQGWENYGGGVFTDVSVEVPPHDGTTSVKMFGEFTGVQNDQVLLQTVPGIQAGETYTLSGYTWHNSLDAVQQGNLVLLQMTFQNAAGAPLETIEQVGITPGSTPTDQWNLVEVTGIAPANTAQILVAVLHLQLDGAATGATFWDDIRLIQGGGSGCNNPADFDGSGVVDVFDLLGFIDAYTQGC